MVERQSHKPIMEYAACASDLFPSKGAPESSSNDEIRDELQQLLNNLRVRRISPKVAVNGNPVMPGNGPGSDGGLGSSASGSNGGDGLRHKPTDLSVLPTGAKRANLFRNLERAPEIVLLRKDDEIEEKELKGRAARYYLEPSSLFVNMQYPAIAEMTAQLEDEYASASDFELMRSLALQIAERTMILRVGRTVVYALAKQLNKEWNQKAVETASSPESLSMAADDFADAMQNARRAIGKALRPNRATTESQSRAAILEESS